MSYDVCVGDMAENMTSNVSRMWDRAMPDLNLRDMDGKKAKDCLPHLRDGVRHMAEHRHSYTPLEPQNGWGSYGGALGFLTQMMFACEDHPEDTVRVYT